MSPGKQKRLNKYIISMHRYDLTRYTECRTKGVLPSMKLRLTEVEVGGEIDQNNVLDSINKPILDSKVDAASFQCDR